MDAAELWDDKQVIDDLLRDGAVLCDQRFAAPQLADIQEYLAERLVLLGGHVRRCCSGEAPGRDFTANMTSFYGRELACYDYDTAVGCPHLLTTALGYLGVAETYLEQSAVIYSMNVWWSFPSGGTRPETQAFHRDRDDTKFLALFFLLSDCLDEGRHIYQAGTNLFREGDGKIILTIAGEAGAMFFSDTSGLHYGEKPTTRPRLTAWARYGVGQPPRNYLDDAIPKVSTPLWSKMSTKERWATRFICEV